MVEKRVQLEEKLPELQHMLRTYVGKRIRDYAGADDIVQNTILEAVRSIESLRDENKLAAWLRGIARNKIHEWYRSERDSRWSRLYENVQATSPAKRNELLEGFNELVDSLGDLDMEPRQMGVIVLKHVMNWTPAEIAATAGVSRRRVYRILQGVKKKMSGSHQPLPDDKRIRLKVWIANALWVASMYPVEGRRVRCLALAREAFHFMRIAYSQTPDDPLTVAIMAQFYLMYAQIQEFENDTEPGRHLWEWQRDRWDQELKQEGLRLHDRLKEMDVRDVLRLKVDAARLVYEPDRYEDIDLPRIHEMTQEYLRRRPSNDAYRQIIQIRAEVEGPMAGARFLEEHLKNDELKDDRWAYERLGMLYYEAGQWLLSRRAYRKFLKFPNSAILREQAETFIRICDEKLKSSPDELPHSHP